MDGDRMKDVGRVTTRDRGVIPGCLSPGKDGHMAVDRHGRPWFEVARSALEADDDARVRNG